MIEGKSRTTTKKDHRQSLFSTPALHADGKRASQYCSISSLYTETATARTIIDDESIIMSSNNTYSEEDVSAYTE
jgi:hypothetical protein